MDESSASLDYRLFVVDDRCYTWRDALGFAELSGDLAACVDQVYGGVVAEDFVSDIDRLPGPAQVQDASHEWQDDEDKNLAARTPERSGTL